MAGLFVVFRFYLFRCSLFSMQYH